jgi:hypothetical protein
MATSVNYTGRTADLLIFQGAAAVGDAKITLGFGTAGYLTTGAQKMSQTFTILFLTEIGSIPPVPTEGTNFLGLVRSGRLYDETSLRAAFQVASEKVRLKMASIAVSDNWPDDERLNNVELKSYIVNESSSTLVLYTKLTSAAGATRTIYLPISVPIR